MNLKQEPGSSDSATKNTIQLTTTKPRTRTKVNSYSESVAHGDTPGDDKNLLLLPNNSSTLPNMKGLTNGPATAAGGQGASAVAGLASSNKEVTPSPLSEDHFGNAAPANVTGAVATLPGNKNSSTSQEWILKLNQYFG